MKRSSLSSQFIESPTQLNTGSPDAPPEQKTASDFGKQLAACLNKIEPQVQECESIFLEMQKKGIRTLDFGGQQIHRKGMERLTAALEHQHSFLTHHLTALNFKDATFRTISPLLILLRKVKGGSMESFNFSGIRILTIYEQTGKEHLFPLQTNHCSIISDIVRLCSSLRSLNMDGQIVLSALTIPSNGGPKPAPPMIELMEAVAESSLVEVSFKDCDLGPSDLRAIGDAIEKRESIEKPGSGLQIIRADKNPRMIDKESYADAVNLIAKLNENLSLQELHLPYEIVRAFDHRGPGFDLPSNSTLKELTPITSPGPYVPYCVLHLRDRLRYNRAQKNPIPSISHILEFLQEILRESDKQ